MNKTRFAVDSGGVLIIDPQFLANFASQFSYKDFINHSGRGKKAQRYIDRVAKKALPKASLPLIGYLHSDGLLGDTEFVGDGRYELCSNSIRMTSQYRLVFEAWLKNYGKRSREKRVLSSQKPSRQHPRPLHRAK